MTTTVYSSNSAQTLFTIIETIIDDDQRLLVEDRKAIKRQPMLEPVGCILRTIEINIIVHLCIDDN